MKKLAFIGSIVASLLTPVQVFAEEKAIKLFPPPNAGYGTITEFISSALVLVFAVAILIVLIMLILGAYEWIVSGGDKEAVGKARNRIINALVGLVILAVAFALTRVLAQFTGLNIENLIIRGPATTSPSPGTL